MCIRDRHTVRYAPTFSSVAAALSSTDLVSSSLLHFFSESIFDKLFVLQTLGLDNTVKATYVGGRKVYDRDRDERFSYADKR